jgi:hypothetical protein
MEMVDKGNGTFTMGNGLDRQQRLINFEGMDICVFRVRDTGTTKWEDRWSADAHPLGFASPFFTCYVSRTTMRKAVTDAFNGAQKPVRIVV